METLQNSDSHTSDLKSEYALGKSNTPLERNKNESAETILQAAIDLSTTIKDAREEMDKERRLPNHLINELKKAGVFRMTMPKDWGGAQLDPISQLKIIEALSQADASVGWCVMVGCDSGLFSGFIDQSVARQMYSDVNSITASALTTTGRAVKVKDGYRVSGRMPFSSGCHHSDWFVLGCQVYDGDTPQLMPDGTPVTRQCFLPADAITILDTWNTLGLRGTGSNDLVVDNYFVAEEQSFSYQEIKCFRKGALYQFPMNILLNFSSVPIGVAQAALDSFTEHGPKPSRLMTIQGKIVPQRSLREEGFVQDTVGRAAAKLGSARAYLYTSIGDLWDSLESGKEPSVQEFTNFQLVHTYVFETCVEVVQMIYKIRGGTAVYSGNDLDRCFRDIVTMNQHVVNSLRAFTSGGQAILGLPPEQILL